MPRVACDNTEGTLWDMCVCVCVNVTCGDCVHMLRRDVCDLEFCIAEAVMGRAIWWEH